MTKKILTITGYALALLVFFVVVLAGFTQSKLFKDRLRVFLVSTITTSTNGTLSLGTIRGNFVTGITIDSLALRVGEDNFLSMGEIAISYDLFSLLRKRVVVRSVTIDSPTVVLERGNDGRWNIDRLMKPAAPSEPAPFDWTIRLDKLRINNGTFILKDRVALASPRHPANLPHQVEYHDIRVSDIDLTCGGQYVEGRSSLKVENLSFESRNPRFVLRQFRGEFSVSPAGAEARSVLIRTSESNLQLTAALQGVNLFDGIRLEQLQRTPTTLVLVADAVDLNELKRFIPQIDFLNGTATIDLDARGAFGNLRIDHLNVRTFETSFKIAGSLQNLHRPRDLFIQAEIQEGHVVPGDAGRLLPPFNIPSFARAGPLELKGRFTGTPVQFIAGVSISGEMGDLQAESNLNLRKNSMEYAGEFQSRGFFLSRFFTFPEPTLLTGNGRIKGTGTSFRTMTASARVSLDSSVVRSMALGESEIQGEARGGKLQASATITSRDTRITVACNADFADSDRTSFDAEADVAGLDLAKILNDEERQSNLSFHASLSGTGSDVADLSGRMRVDFSPSSYQAYDFSEAMATLSFDQRNPQERSLEVASPIADVRLRGTFSLEGLLDRMDHEYRQLASSVSQRSSFFEGTPVMEPRPYRESPFSPISMHYTVLVKDLKPLSVFLGGSAFNGRGVLEGSISSDAATFQMTCSTTVNELFIGTVEKGVFIDGGKASIELASREPTRNQTAGSDYIDGLTLNLRTRAAFGIANTHTLDNSSFHLSLKQGKGHVDLHSRLDSLATISASGEIAAGQQAYSFVFDTLSALFGSLAWTSENKVVVSADRAGMRVGDVELRRGKERVTFHGAMQRDGTIDAALSLRQFGLSGLGEYSGARELQKDRGFAGSMDLDLAINGTTAAPRMLLTGTCDNLALRGRDVGRFRSTVSYENRTLNIDMKLTSPPDAPTKSDLSLAGHVPVDLAFGAVEKRFPDQPMSLTLSSEDFDAGLLDPLIASVDELQGKLSCDVRIEGTPDDPQYNGAITSPEVRFLFVPNKLTYILKGRLEASEDRINLASVEIANDPGDQPDGSATVNGSLIVRNFRVESFDLTANGQLLLLKESGRRTSNAMYGRLFAAIGSEGLRFSGSFNRSYLTGSIYVREANLIFPSTREDAYSTRETSLNYIVVDDTSRTDVVKEQLTEQFYRADAGGKAAGRTLEHAQQVRTLWDGMEYDIEVETQGTTEVRMIFNQATNEELYAELDGKVVLQGRRQRGAQIVGEIAVSERSYYNFFKRFNANGTLKFVGQPDNPELNITAKYEGTKRSQVQGDSLVSEEKVIVTLAITGTRYEPKVGISMTVDGEAASGDVESNAISFILTGKFRDDLTSREKSDLATSLGASAGASLLYGLPSQMLSGAVSEFLRSELGFIHSAEVSYLGGSLQETADLRLSGEVGRAYWRFGGRIFNDIGNANVSFQVSMGEVLSSPRLRNLFIELERKVEGAEHVDEKKLTNTARIFYRFSF